MIKKILFIIIVCLCMEPYIIAIQRGISNTQAELNGARVAALGGTNPTLDGEITAFFINPATLANIDAIPFSYTSKQLIKEFDYMILNTAIPFFINLPIKKDRIIEYRITTGLSYGSALLKDIPKTVYSEAEIFELYRYSSGFDYLQTAIATNLYDLFGFNEIGIGSAFKVVRHIVDNQHKSTFAFDLGLIFSKNIDYYILDSMHFGLSFHNLLANPIIWTHDLGTNEETLPLKIYTGFRYDLFKDKMSLFVNNATSGIALGVEYFLQNNLILRGSYEGTKINVGMGILFPKIYGLNQQQYRFRLDYHYTQNKYPLNSDPSHSMSISLLGASKPKPPFIIFPDEPFILTNIPYYDLIGNAEKKTSIQIYRNNTMIKTSEVNKFGDWNSIDFPLKEGMNNIFVKSYEISKDLSSKSNKVNIYLDTSPPELNLTISPGKETLELIATSNELLAEVTAEIGTINITFKERDKIEKEHPYISPDKASYWTAVATFPEHLKDGARVPTKMDNIVIKAMDLSGNESTSNQIPFFIELTFPKDKYVHYKENIRLIGHSSPLVLALNVNNNPVYIDDEHRFSITGKLEPGKNLVNLDITTLNDKKINYNFRVLRLVTYDDLTDKTKFRREIEFLSTLGLLSGEEDGNFYPDKKVTREYVTKLMVDADDELELALVRDDVFDDVPSDHPYAKYISTAVNNGLIFAFPDGTFKPAQALTMSEIVFLLSSAGIIDAQEVEDENKVLNRSELAEFLAYTPFYERKIERLINWKVGYEQNKEK